MSKGSNRRPRKVSQQEADKNWDVIFSKPTPKLKGIKDESNEISINTPLNYPT